MMKRQIEACMVRRRQPDVNETFTVAEDQRSPGQAPAPRPPSASVMGHSYRRHPTSSTGKTTWDETGRDRRDKTSILLQRQRELYHAWYTDLRHAAEKTGDLSFTSEFEGVVRSEQKRLDGAQQRMQENLTRRIRREAAAAQE